MKVKFAVCDDEEIICDAVASRALACFNECGIEGEMEQFSDPMALARACKVKKYDLVLLDIDMPKVDGIKLASALKTLSAPPVVIFVSGREERVFDAFHAQPFRFVRKSKFKEELSEAIRAYIKAVENDAKTVAFEVKNKSNVENIAVKDIEYIESFRNCQSVYIVNESEPLQIKYTMEELENLLSEYNILRVHKGYLVNLSYIRRITQTDIILKNDVMIPVSRRKIQEVKTLYLQYLRQTGSVMIDE